MNKDDTDDLTKSDLEKAEVLISLLYLPDIQVNTILRKQQDVLTKSELAILTH